MILQAAKALVNADITKLPKPWIAEQFKDIPNAVSADGVCRTLNVCGDAADPDSDGLNNLGEYSYATNPNVADSDEDGLSDGDEIKVYYSNPKQKDSDSDTFEDGSEVTNCYDPNVSSKSKMNSFRLSEITSNTNTYSIHKNTISTLTGASGTQDDIEKGYIVSNCGQTESLTSKIDSAFEK